MIGFVKRRVCKKRGHVHPWVVWYYMKRGERFYCARCGEQVHPLIDWSGHP